MAAYTDIISIVGGAASNSYVSGAETDSFAALQSWGDGWLAKSESERTIAIVSACSWLETVDWEGTPLRRRRPLMPAHHRRCGPAQGRPAMAWRPAAR